MNPDGPDYPASSPEGHDPADSPQSGGAEPLRPSSTQNAQTGQLRTDVADLEDQCQQLRTLFNATFVGLIVLSLSVALFMMRQRRSVQAQVDELSPAYLQLRSEFIEIHSPRIRQLVLSLNSFATTNRDFLPVLEKYRARLNQFFPATLSVAPPTGSPTSAPGAPKP